MVVPYYVWDPGRLEIPPGLAADAASWRDLAGAALKAWQGSEPSTAERVPVRATLLERGEGRSGVRVVELSVHRDHEPRPDLRFILRRHADGDAARAERERDVARRLKRLGSDYLACDLVELEGEALPPAVAYRHGDDATATRTRPIHEYLVDAVRSGRAGVFAGRLRLMCENIARLYDGSMTVERTHYDAARFFQSADPCVAPALTLDVRNRIEEKQPTWAADGEMKIPETVSGGMPGKKVKEVDLGGLEIVGRSNEDRLWYRLTGAKFAAILAGGGDDREGAILAFEVRHLEHRRQVWVRGPRSFATENASRLGREAGLTLNLPDAGLASYPEVRLADLGYPVGSFLVAEELFAQGAELLGRGPALACQQHGDLHSLNVLVSDDKMKVVDVGDMTTALPTADQARLETSLWRLAAGELGLDGAAAAAVLSALEAPDEPGGEISGPAADWLAVVRGLRDGFAAGRQTPADEAATRLAYATEVAAFQRYDLKDETPAGPAFATYCEYWRERLLKEDAPPAQSPPPPPAGDKPCLVHLWEKALRTGVGAMLGDQDRVLNTVRSNDVRMDRPLTLLQHEVWRRIVERGENPFLRPEHVLLSGPTGSGKSTVAEMFLLATPVLNLTRRKAVYVAPTRALAQAKYRDLMQLLKGDLLAADTVLSTGEDTQDDGRIGQGNFVIACLVYEKANVLFSRNQDVLAEIGLCVVDEMHMLADKHRGPSLELLLAKLLEQRQKSENTEDDSLDQFPLRVVGITTEDRPDDSVTSFFTYMNRATNEDDLPIAIQSPERPVRLAYHLVLPPEEPASDGWSPSAPGTPPWDAYHLVTVEPERPRLLSSEDRQRHAAQLDARWADLVAARRDSPDDYRNELKNRLVAFLLGQLKAHPRGRRWMVFVPSKGLMENIALELRNRAGNPTAFPQGLPTALTEALDDTEDREEAETIEKLAKAGLFLHNSDIPRKVRQAIEEICNLPLTPAGPPGKPPSPADSSPSQILFCTETLSFGVNLAINDVLMMGTKFWSSTRTQGSEPEHLSACSVHNMAGRAGRLGRSDRDEANFYLFLPLEGLSNSPIRLILEKYFCDVPRLWSQLFVKDDKDPFSRQRKKWLQDGKVDEYLRAGRPTAEDFSYPFVRSVLDVLRHRGVVENSSVATLMEFFDEYTLYARQKFTALAADGPRDVVMERTLFGQALDDTLASCADSPLNLTKTESAGPPVLYSITERGLAVIETGTEIRSIAPLLKLRARLRAAWEAAAPGEAFPVEMYLLAFVGLEEIYRKFIRYTPERWAEEGQPERRMRETGVISNKNKVLEAAVKALRGIGVSDPVKLAQTCRQILDDTEAVQKIKADYPKGGVESVLRGFTAMLLWVNGEKKGRVIRQIGWLDPDFDGDAEKNGKRQRVSNFTQLCDQIAWRTLFLHRILTRADDKGEVQTDEQRDLLLLADRIRLGCKTGAIPLFWPNGSRLRRDEAHELLKRGFEPTRMLTTNEPQTLDQHVRPKRLTQLKQDLTGYSWKQFQSLGNTMRSRRVKGQREVLFQFWGECMEVMRLSAEEYRRPAFRPRGPREGAGQPRSVDAHFRAALPEVAKVIPARLGGGSGPSPLEASPAPGGSGVTLVERTPSGQPGRRFLLTAVQVLPDWQAVRPPGPGLTGSGLVPLASVLEAMKNDSAHQPVLVCFPWKPATEMMPKDLRNQLDWRAANGRTAPTFLTPAAALCALTLLARGFVEARHAVDLIAGPAAPPAAGFRLVRLAELLTTCDKWAEDEYWRTPLLREAMLRHFEADTV